MSVKKYFAWINSDLDGVGCSVLLSNIFKDYSYNPVFFGEFEQKYSEWIEENREKYDKILIIGMPLDQSVVNRFDDTKVTFITNKNNPLKVHDSGLIQEEITSCSKLIYKKFKDVVEFSDNVKKFVVYVDDYKSYKLKHEETKYLNALYRKSGSRKFNNLHNRFQKGFDGFTDREVALAGTFFSDLEKEKEKLDLFKGEFKKSSVIATISKFSVNEISSHLLDYYESDVSIIVNTDSQYVSFRKREGSNADIVFMAENLCNGGGTEQAAGGKITQKFLDFISNLSPYEQ